ncbi:transglycosylase family protein [Streptomyces parvus]|uniref:transglycosylase family protein n=1 Tax=Streptomyces parvus TaxID=66428 RepID=UPI00292A4275|nr:transglycosylase family protein [Streptomyces parvus]
MGSANGRHRRPRQAPAIVVAAGVTGSAIAIPLLGASGATAAEAATWDRVAECESGGMWSADLGNGYYGGLQLSQETWSAYGGTEFAPRADLASRSQQISVAEKVLDDQGPKAWPSCAVISGLAVDGSLPGVDPGTSPAPDPTTTPTDEADAPDEADESGKSGEADESGKSDKGDETGKGEKGDPAGEGDSGDAEKGGEAPDSSVTPTTPPSSGRQRCSRPSPLPAAPGPRPCAPWHAVRRRQARSSLWRPGPPHHPWSTSRSWRTCWSRWPSAGRRYVPGEALRRFRRT